MDTNMEKPAVIDPAHLPVPVRDFLAAHLARDVDTAAAAFAPDAVVVDDGRTYRGREEVAGFLRHGGGPYTYSTELVGAERVDDTHWVAVNRLEGDFPGGVVELRYRFATSGELVTELVIAP
jgi:ketosteroid isomerase-like protein